MDASRCSSVSSGGRCSLSPRFDLVCSACGREFAVEADRPPTDDERRCPDCGSDRVRQTFASYVRNGPLLDPKWGQGPEFKGCG